jgi:hypothetical protein
VSFIGHRCGCGHSDLQHIALGNGRKCRASNATSCAKPCRKNPKSSVFATFDAKAKPVERIIPPGGRLATEGNVGPTTCDCDDCKALYAELTGQEVTADA